LSKKQLHGLCIACYCNCDQQYQYGRHANVAGGASSDCVDHVATNGASVVTDESREPDAGWGLQSDSEVTQSRGIVDISTLSETVSQSCNCSLTWERRIIIYLLKISSNLLHMTGMQNNVHL
jgi:hypothetical protein